MKITKTALTASALVLAARCYAEAPMVQRPESWAKRLSLEKIEVDANGARAVLRWREDYRRAKPFRLVTIPLGGTVEGITLDEVVLDAEQNMAGVLLSKDGRKHRVYGLQLRPDLPIRPAPVAEGALPVRHSYADRLRRRKEILEARRREREEEATEQVAE